MALTRRQFLIGLGGVGAAATVAGCSGSTGPGVGGAAQDHSHGSGVAGGPVTGSTVPSHAVAAAGGTLVVLTLYGGNDALDTVIPAGDGTYRTARGDLARAEDEVLALSGGLGFHPGLTRLHDAWGQGELAVVRGVGFAGLDRSHFHCMDVWQAGGEDDMGSGWLGRWLDQQHHDPLLAIGIGDDLPLLLRGRKASGSSIPIGAGGFAGPGPLADLFAALHAPDPSGAALLQAAAVAGRDMLTVSDRVDAIVGSPGGDHPADDDPVDGGGSAKAGGDAGGGGKGAAGGLAAQLDQVAALVEGDFPARVYTVGMGGFDTHSTALSTRDRLMAELDDGLGRFLERVARRPVTVLVHSEFGRRAAVNGSGGTDHGSAGVALLCGPTVKGGFYGDEPALTDLVDGDLRTTVDFRSLYASVLEGVLEVDPDVAIADAARYPALPILA